MLWGLVTSGQLFLATVIPPYGHVGPNDFLVLTHEGYATVDRAHADIYSRHDGRYTTVGLERKLGRFWEYGPAAAQLTDALASIYGKHRGNRELNPVVAPMLENNELLFVATKVGVGLVVGKICKAVHNAGHPRAARIISGFTITVGVAPAIDNVSTAHGRSLF